MTKTRFLSRFTPSLMTSDALEAIFVQRERLLQEILDYIRGSATTTSKQHMLLVGPRGLGKTHLISLIYYRVYAMEDLRDRLLIAWLREEEWGVTCFRDLLIRILRSLRGQVPDEAWLEKQIESIHALRSEQAEATAAKILTGLVGGRTLLMLVENLDDLFRRLGGEGQSRFREFLKDNPFFAIVATSPITFDGVLLSKAAFGGFFHIRELEGLTLEDAGRLMMKIARYEGNTSLAAFVSTPQGRARLRALRYLAGGNHRAFVIFSQLLARETLDDLIEPLMRTIDDLTPYYNARIADLSSDQRKVIEYACDTYRPVRVAEVSRDCFLDPESTAWHLDCLTKLGYMRGLSVDQEKYYELREPLMRLSIEVKKHRGKPLRLLVDFLRLWYSPAELKERLATLPTDAGFEREYTQPALLISEKEWKDPRVYESCRIYLDAAKENDYTRALQAAEELVAIRGQVWDLSAQASCLTNLGRYDEAAALYDRIVKMAPTHAPTWQQRAWTLFRVGKLEEALESCNRSIELDNDRGRSWCCRGSILAGLGQLDEALASCDTAIKLNDKDALAWTTRGMILADLTRYDDTAAAFARVVDLSPDELQGYHYQCAALIELKQYDRALTLARRAIEIEARNSIAWLLQGLALAGLGQHDEALRSLDKALELGEETSFLYFKRAELQLALGRWRAGAASLDNALERFSHSANPDSGNTTVLVRNLFASLYDPKILVLCAKTLVIIYQKHNALPALGHGLIECIPEVASPSTLSNEEAHTWRDAWKTVAGDLPEFRLPLRFLQFAVLYRETQDLRVLMELPMEERVILESMIGVRVQVTA